MINRTGSLSASPKLTNQVGRQKWRGHVDAPYVLVGTCSVSSIMVMLFHCKTMIAGVDGRKPCTSCHDGQNSW